MSFHNWYAACEPHRFGELTTPVRDDGDGAPVVCLHGFPTTAWDFEPMWPDLTAEFRMVAFDLIGLGKASKPSRPLPIALQADVAESVATALGITSAHILAHDLGDTVAQELLARQADGSSKVDWISCCFLNGGIFPETHYARPIQKMLMSPLGGLIARFAGESTFRKNMTNVFGPDTPPTAEFLDASWELLEADNGRLMLPRLIRYMAERRAHRERWVQPLVDKVVPTRLINGSRDPVSGRHAAERFAELIPDADVVHLARLGHYPHVEGPAETIEPILEFLRHQAKD
jgi:pimeloyl-ACP methyl ester carboxylesterase